MTDTTKDPSSQGPRRKRSAKRRPRRRGRKPKPISTVAIIDRLLLAPVRISLNGKQITITAVEAIMDQLFRKEMAGDAHAARVYLQYEELAKPRGKRRLHIEFVNSDYTRALTDNSSKVGHG